MGKYVIYHTALDDLGYLQEKNWDLWCDRDPKNMQREVSRGHTITEAINLTKLVNEQQEIEQ